MGVRTSGSGFSGSHGLKLVILPPHLFSDIYTNKNYYNKYN